MKINELKKRAYDIAVKKGWYEKKLSEPHFIMLIVTELGEAVNADRENKHADRVEFERVLNSYTDLGFDKIFEAYIKDTVEDEFADAIIRILSFAGGNGVVLPEQMYDDQYIAEAVSVANGACDLGELNRDVTLPEELFLIVCDLVNMDTAEYSLHETLFTLFVVAKRRGIDFKWHVEQKMKYNELRPYKHGGKKY